MKVLVACEESQEVCKAFRRLGHEAYSADLQDCSGDHPEWHIKGDVLPLLNGNCQFITVGGVWTYIEGRWDLIIAHPPCTDLTVSGARWFPEKQKDFRQQKSCVFFMQMMLADAVRVAVENPIGIMSSCYRPPDQIIQPYQFGHPARKATCLWLRNLPKLRPTNIVKPETIEYTCKNGKTVRFSADYGVGYNRSAEAKRRSKTYIGIGEAMAEQWGALGSTDDHSDGIEPLRNEDSIYGFECGYCSFPVAFQQHYCEECGKRIRWDNELKTEE